MVAVRKSRLKAESLDRAREFTVRWAEGESLQSIADDYGLTRERVRQLIALGGQREWAAEQRRRREELRKAEEARARIEKRRRAAEQPIPRSPVWLWRPGITRDEVVERVRAWLEAGGDGSPMQWDAEGCKPVHSYIHSRYGWREIVEDAGGTAYPHTRDGRYRVDRFTREEALMSVVEFLLDDTVNGTGALAYDEWAKKFPRDPAHPLRGTKPSLATVRNRFTSWTEARNKAASIVREMRERERGEREA